MHINQAITAWDGKSADAIGAVYDRYHGSADFIDTLLELINDTGAQKGATRLLKKWLQSGNRLAAEDKKKVYASVHLLTDWQSRLHLLQSIPYIPIDEDEKATVASFLRVTLTDSNKFVRAWSYNGLYELARRHPEYLEQTKQFFALAMRDEAASVQARIRNILKKGF